MARYWLNEFWFSLALEISCLTSSSSSGDCSYTYSFRKHCVANASVSPFKFSEIGVWLTASSTSSFLKRVRKCSISWWGGISNVRDFLSRQSAARLVRELLSAEIMGSTFAASWMVEGRLQWKSWIVCCGRYFLN